MVLKMEKHRDMAGKKFVLSCDKLIFELKQFERYTISYRKLKFHKENQEYEVLEL